MNPHGNLMGFLETPLVVGEVRPPILLGGGGPCNPNPLIYDPGANFFGQVSENLKQHYFLALLTRVPMARSLNWPGKAEFSPELSKNMPILTDENQKSTNLLI